MYFGFWCPENAGQIGKSKHSKACPENRRKDIKLYGLDIAWVWLMISDDL
jgi:hypothetical protein